MNKYYIINSPFFSFSVEGIDDFILDLNYINAHLPSSFRIVKSNSYKYSSVLICHIGECIIGDHKGSRLTVPLENGSNINDNFLKIIYLNIDFLFLKMKVLGIHGSVISKGGRAIALIGEYGSGKTHLSLELKRVGGQIEYSDFFYINVDSLQVLDGPKRVYFSELSYTKYFHDFPPIVNGAYRKNEKIDISTCLQSIENNCNSFTLLTFVKFSFFGDSLCSISRYGFDDFLRISSSRVYGILRPYNYCLKILEGKKEEIERINLSQRLSHKIDFVKISGSTSFVKNEVFAMFEREQNGIV